MRITRKQAYRLFYWRIVTLDVLVVRGNADFLALLCILDRFRYIFSLRVRVRVPPESSQNHSVSVVTGLRRQVGRELGCLISVLGAERLRVRSEGDRLHRHFG